ncbi:Lar family restriction alleviation protein [Paenibacillus sp. JJ1722]|uniref:Lar family restriction alleviation protein n=1 Tax=Paenibacillus sp. JJ1722 TaxID=3398770 RepID=UPI003AB01EF0
MKACPFCGGTPYINRWHSEKGTSIKCKNCGCTTQVEYGENGALAVWNKRTAETARPLDEWGEDYGDVLWWKFPIVEPPYCGTPLDADWPDYHTHWTPITIPILREEQQ